jgi:thiol-disulfide isomerase/thioredoxin
MTRRAWIAPSLAAGALTGINRPDAPDFRARSLAQAVFTKANLKGKVVIIQFWATWCGFCRRDQDDIDEVYLDLSQKGLEFLAVNVEEPERKVRDYLSRGPRVVPVVLSSETDLLAKFPARAFPTYIVIDRAGKVAGAAKGSQGREGLLRLAQAAGLT